MQYSCTALNLAKSRQTSLKVNVKQCSSQKTKAKSKPSMDNAPKERRPSKRKGCIAPASLQIYAPFFSSLSKEFSSDEIRDMIVKTVHFHDSLIENHGVKDGTKRFKAMFAYCTALLESRKAVNPGWVATSKANRFPTKLAHLRSLFIFIKDNNNKPNPREDCRGR